MKKITTALFCLSLLTSALATDPPLWQAPAAAKAMADRQGRPNVLFIICDDLNDWVLHPSGHPNVKTPNMDRLRNRSVNFSNAHVAVPVCGPSRKCLFSGLYPHTINSYGFSNWKQTPGLKKCAPIPQHFRNNGYHSFGAGKLLHGGRAGNFYTNYGNGVDYGPLAKDAGGKITWVHPSLYARWGDVMRYRGGPYVDFSYGPLSDIPRWDVADGATGIDGWFYSNGRPMRYESEADRDPTPDERSAAYACKVLGQDHDRPFFLGVGFVRPHTPLFAPKKYFDLYPLEDITLPPVLEGDLDDCAEALRNHWLWSFRKLATIRKLGGETLWKEWIRAYLACTSYVDDQLGRVLDALESSPYADNTIIVFTSDNGYHLGEKANMQKWHLWDESTRVPLFIHVPEGAGNGQSCEHPVSVVDLYPTLADLCGLSPDPNKNGSKKPLDGHSLRPFLENPETDQWDGPSVAYMAIGRSHEDAEGWSIGPHHSVRSRRYRYTLCGNGEEELYDHEKDPNEWTNLAANPEYAGTKDELRRILIDMRETGTNKGRVKND